MLLLTLPAALAAPPSPAVADAPASVEAALLDAWALPAGPERMTWATRQPQPRPDPSILTIVLELVQDADEQGVTEDALALHPEVGVEARAPGRLQLAVPYDVLPDLAWIAGVARVRQPRLARAREVVTEGRDIIFEEDWHAQGVTGEGVTVAILDIGFNGWDDLLGEELPEDTVAAFDDAGSSSHGAAVAEIVHDIAPGATLRLYRFLTDVEYGEQMVAISDDGVDVVNASIGFDNIAHADGEGYAAQLVDALADEGVVYVAAAGNEVGRYRIGPLTDVDGDGLVELDGQGEITLDASFGYAEASLRWSEVFGEAAVDLDLELVGASGVCDAGRNAQDGDDLPYESATCANVRGLVVARVTTDGALPEGLTGYLYAPAGLGATETASVDSTLTLPADAKGAIAVGATDPDTGALLDYSSHGPTDDGRTKPDVVAPGVVSTASLAGFAFEGTSAAAPHVAGVAALILSQRTHARVSTVRDILMEQAEDIAPDGVDNATGAGEVRTRALPGSCGCGVGGGGGWVALLLPLLLARRRA
ncbi:MAG: S8 family serine peptidase [Alphaproteobacteria bacterium]|nr:S8 family serine peptidase [Alphaproteobacteria bacterium]